MTMEPGAAKHTQFPGSTDGIDFTVGRMVEMIQEARKDPLVIATARKIAALSTSGKKLKGFARHLTQLRGIYAWCQGNFEFVNDPVNVELIQTPNRMLRELEIPPQLHKAMWYLVGKEIGGKMPAPKMTGDADEATVISLSLAAAIGIAPLKIRLGGDKDGGIYTCWGAAYAGGAKKSEPAKWWDINILHDKFGSHGATNVIKDIEVTF
jgi:hypothetical protein